MVRASSQYTKIEGPMLCRGTKAQPDPHGTSVKELEDSITVKSGWGDPWRDQKGSVTERGPRRGVASGVLKIFP